MMILKNMHQLMIAGCIILGLLGGGPQLALGSTETTLARYDMAQAVARGLHVNSRIKAAEYLLESADMDVKAARGGFLPRVSARAGRDYIRSVSASGAADTDYMDQHTDSATLQVSQPLFAGLTVLNTYQKAQLREELVRVDKRHQELQLVIEIQTAFLDLLKAREDLRSLTDAVERLEMGVTSIRAFEKDQMAPYVDVLKAEVDLSDAIQNLSQVQNRVRTQHIRLNTLLEIDPDEPVAYVGELANTTVTIPWTLEECLGLAFRQRGELLMEEKTLAMAKKELAITKGRFMPTVNLDGSYTTRSRSYDDSGIDAYGRSLDRDSRSDYWSVGLNVQWSIFEGGRTHYNRRRAELEIARLRERIHDIRNTVGADVRTYYIMLQEAGERISTTRKATGEALENHNRSRVRFESQVATITELLDAQARVTRAEANHNQSLADYQQALARLLNAMGEYNGTLTP